MQKLVEHKVLTYCLFQTPTAEEKSKSKSVEVEATPGPSRKRAADSLTEVSPKKVHNENDSADGRDCCSNITENEKKLESTLRYEQHKMRKQVIKMERLERKLRTLKMTITDMEDLYFVLEGKLNISAENIMSLKSTAVKVCLYQYVKLRIYAEITCLILLVLFY